MKKCTVVTALLAACVILFFHTLSERSATAGKQSIKVYGPASDGPTKQALDALKKWNAEHTFIDVSKSALRKREAQRKARKGGFRGDSESFPVIEIDGTVLVSPDLSTLKKHISTGDPDRRDEKRQEPSRDDSETPAGSWDYRTMYDKYDHEGFASTFGKRPFDERNVDEALLAAAIFYATNKQRAANSRKPFRYSHVLFQAAHMHSKDMAEQNFFSHTSPLSGRKSPGDRINKFGTWSRGIAENIADNYPRATYLQTAEALLDGWMNSPGHRKNILNASYSFLGAAAACRRGRVLSTQNFATGIDGFVSK